MHRAVVSTTHAREGDRRRAWSARFLRVRGVALLAVAAVLGPACAGAFAGTSHEPLFSLAEAPAGTPLVAPEAVATDQAGDLFVADPRGAGVDEYGPSGTLVTQFGQGMLGRKVTGIAVDHAGRVYVANTQTDAIDVFALAEGRYGLVLEIGGTQVPGGAFGRIAGIAVNDAASGPTAGDVYVVDERENAVDVLGPVVEKAGVLGEGAYQGRLKGVKLEEPDAVAVNAASGDVYVADTAKGGVYVFGPEGTFKLKVTGKGTPEKSFGTVNAVAAEQATNDIYVVDSSNRAVDQFSEAGEWLGELEPSVGPFPQPVAVAVDQAGRVYVASSVTPVEAFQKEAVGLTFTPEAAVDVFGADVPYPTVTTGKATEFARTAGGATATLNGTVNPAGAEVTYWFEYRQQGTTTFSKTSSAHLPAGTTAESVHATASGLRGESSYEFRVAAEGPNGIQARGGLVSFVTPALVLGVSTGPATVEGPTAAKLTGSLAPKGVPTTYRFEYGETLNYGHATSEVQTSSTTPVSAEQQASGLRADTLYHFRIMAENEVGVTYGSDQTFTTPGAPIIRHERAEASGNHATETVATELYPGSRATKYHVEYGESPSYGNSSAEAEVPAGEKAVTVTVKLENLKPGAAYHFRVVAVNEVRTTDGADAEFTTTPIESESVVGLTSESAFLAAQIDPLGAEASYHFEYGESTAYGASVPVPDASLGAPTTPVQAQQHIVGLHASTTYHYRVVVDLGGMTIDGPDRDFTTTASGGAFALPDNRAYEQVTPVDKHGGYVIPVTPENPGPIQASEDGNAIASVTIGPIVEPPEGNRSPEAQQVLSVRTPEGWRTQSLVTPHEKAWGLRPGQPDEYQLFSGDLALALVQPLAGGTTPLAEPPLAPPATPAERGHQEKTIYLRANPPVTPSESETASYAQAQHNGETLAAEHGEAAARPGFLPLVTAANVLAGAKFGGFTEPETKLLDPNLEPLAATPDLSHVVMRSIVPIAPGPGTQGAYARELYEWSAGSLQQVSVLPSGTLPHQPVLGLATQNGHEAGFDYRNAISNDGSRVFWSAVEAEPVGGGIGHLYVRQTVKGETLQLDVPEAGLAQLAQGEARFQIASADGSRVFFTDPQRLTGDSTARPGSPDLYECTLTEVAGKLKCALTDLTVDANTSESAAVQGLVLGAAEDGSRVYFVATGALAAGATPGADNLYVASFDGSSWHVGFVAGLSGEDAPDWFHPTKLSALLVDQTTRVSPNGRYLAFMSNRSLTGYDNVDVHEEEVEREVEKVKVKEVLHHADEEVFLYDAAGGSIVCVSCNPSGARPQGVFDTEFAGEGKGLVVDRVEDWTAQDPKVAHWLAGSIPGWTALTVDNALYQSRYLSNEGRLYFNSADALVPAAQGDVRPETIVPEAGVTTLLQEGKPVSSAQATVGVENVYQYEPAGVGGCTTSGGCVSLLSGASSQKESAFLDASVTGDNVFFVTAASLVSQDKDTSYDIYDARVCTEASPCLTAPPPSPPPCESAEGCGRGASSLPAFESAVSSSFSGPGNTTVHVTPQIQTLPAKTSKPLTNAQKLALALKSCRKLPHRTHAQKQRRARCEAQAHKKYGPKKKGKSARRGGRSR